MVIRYDLLIKWIDEMVAFANGESDLGSSLYDESDADLDDSHRLPQEYRSTDQIAMLRKRVCSAFDRLIRVNDLRRSGFDRFERVEDLRSWNRLRRWVMDWLEDPLVGSTHPAYGFTPIDAIISLDKNGRLQIVPLFRSIDAKYAVTFAELIDRDARVQVRRCRLNSCRKFFTRVRGQRGRPPESCCAAHASTARVHKHRGGRK